MRLLLTFLLITLGGSVYSQQTEADLIRTAFQSEKKEIVSSYLSLTDDEATRFWPIYAKYEQERIAVGTRRIELMDKYLNKAKTELDDASADEMVSESASIQKTELSLREKYYKIIKKDVNTAVAARFYQVEDAINVSIRNELLSKTPLLKR
jgi:hypothetical protein